MTHPLNATLDAELTPAPVEEEDPLDTTQLALDPEATIEALYRLETWVRCAHCQEEIDTLGVVRILRARVNFTSTLPRKGTVVVCPHCRTVVPAQLGGFM